LLKKRKAELLTELEEIRKRHPKKADSAEQLRERFVNGIKNVSGIGYPSFS
jgi:hypothetical protein